MAHAFKIHVQQNTNLQVGKQLVYKYQGGLKIKDCKIEGPLLRIM